MGAANTILKTALQGAGQARALLYTIESLPLPLMHQLITGEPRVQPTTDQQKYAIKKSQELLHLDAQEFIEFNWPVDFFLPEDPLGHFPRLLQILGDSTRSFLKRKNNQTQVFSKKIKNLEEFPDYYQRNFHHQTDGYLSDQSAHFYEHQVELLFRGLADPMRRRLLRPIYEKIKNKKRPKILEIGCGTGTFTRFLTGVFPRADITGIDLSPAYIRYAKKRFMQNDNVHFLVENAENLPFKNENFDAVVSVFLHHELPRKAREKVLQESLRVCKKEGFWGLCDSVQLNDDENFNWAIESFPKNFHEPFFTNYIKNPLSDYLSTVEPNSDFKEEYHLLSKLVYRS